MTPERQSELFHAQAHKLIERIVLDMLRRKSTYANGIGWEHAEALLRLARKYPGIELDEV